MAEEIERVTPDEMRKKIAAASGAELLRIQAALQLDTVLLLSQLIQVFRPAGRMPMVVRPGRG